MTQPRRVAAMSALVAGFKLPSHGISSCQSTGVASRVAQAGKIDGFDVFFGFVVEKKPQSAFQMMYYFEHLQFGVLSFAPSGHLVPDQRSAF